MLSAGFKSWNKRTGNCKPELINSKTTANCRQKYSTHVAKRALSLIAAVLNEQVRTTMTHQGLNISG